MIQPTATALTLKVKEPLLIVISHYKTKSIASRGLLYLRYDSLIDWTDTDGTEIIASLLPRFKSMMRFGWEVYLAYPSSRPVWWLYDLDAIQYLPASVVIPVESSDFNLGGGK